MIGVAAVEGTGRCGRGHIKDTDHVSAQAQRRLTAKGRAALSLECLQLAPALRPHPLPRHLFLLRIQILPLMRRM